jgi:dienelactone hydrolase
VLLTCVISVTIGNAFINADVKTHMKIPSQRKIAGLTGLAGLAWLSFTALIAASQSKLIFNPVRVREVERPRSDAHRTRPVVLRSTDGTRLHGWLMSPQAPGPHPAVVYFGGRSEEVSWVARDAGRMFPGMTVLAINYRGYGDSAGFPGEPQMVADACMLFDWMAEQGHVDPTRIAVVGRSLGSGVAIQVAVQRPAAALVLITPYDSLLALAKRRFRSVPVGWVLRHRFESIKYVPRLAAPTLILRAVSDDVVPGAHTDMLVARFGTAPQDETVPESDHCNIPYLEATQGRIAQFLAATFCKTPVSIPAAESAVQLVAEDGGVGPSALMPQAAPASTVPDTDMLAPALLKAVPAVLAAAVPECAAGSVDAPAV